ncbi:MAG TPA: restriction endonuclease subunit S [Candidatus Eisenbacteria bacterium]|nr:restriction endonuclease subunit S [Candidatus Eisenbacteria bacterium]
MSLIKYKLGELIEKHDEKCGIPNLSVDEVSGINRDKEFFEPSKQVGANTSNYKVVPVGCFATNLMHVGRDVVLPIAFNHSSADKVVSPAYTIFKVSDSEKVLDEFLFMYFNSEEKDRLFWFYTDASIRDGLSWEDFCDIEIELPPIQIQKKYARVYKSILENQSSYEEGLEDLRLSYNFAIDELKHKASRVGIGDLCSEVDKRNRELEVKSVSGVDIEKKLFPSKANVDETSMKRYKIIEPNQFVFSGMQTGRDKTIRIAMNNTEKKHIVSPAYTVLRVFEDKVIPEYFMLWFSREETDRYGWFISDASIRANLDLERFNEIEIPLPRIRVQKAISDIYSNYIERKEINEKLKARNKTVCPILIKGAMEEASREEV